MTETDLFDNFKNVMPGDSLTEDIEIKNQYPEYSSVKIYLRADPHNKETNPLSPEVAEHETIASMNDFLSKLTLNVYKDSELIYSASPDQPDTLSDYLYLGEFKTGKVSTLHLELSVPTSLTSEYAHRTGEIDWTLLTEESATETSETTSPDTGLPTSAPAYLLPSLLTFFLIFIIFSVIKYRKKHKRIK